MRLHRFPAVVACAGLAVVLVAGLAACSDDSGSDNSSVTTYHEGDSISVDNDEEFVIALEANPSTGYTWDAGQNPNVKFESSKQVSAKGAPPGAPGTQELTSRPPSRTAARSSSPTRGSSKVEYRPRRLRAST